MENDGEFLNEVTSFYERNAEKGTVWLQLSRVEERLSQKGEQKKTQPRCMIRAFSNEKKAKIARMIGGTKIDMYRQGLSKALRTGVKNLIKADGKSKGKAKRNATARGDNDLSKALNIGDIEMKDATGDAAEGMPNRGSSKASEHQGEKNAGGGKKKRK